MGKGVKRRYGVLGVSGRMYGRFFAEGVESGGIRIWERGDANNPEIMVNCRDTGGRCDDGEEEDSSPAEEGAQSAG